MNTQHYDLWIQHHRANSEMTDITESTMASITHPKEAAMARIFSACDQYLVRSGDWAKGGMLAFGAVTGFLRMVFFVYYTLFV